MKLILVPDEELENPGPDQIAETLHKLRQQEGGAVILVNDQLGDEFFLQAAGNPQLGYALEYREGSEEQHFQATEADISVERLVEAFQKYASGDSSWKSDFQWEQMEFKTGKGCLGMMALLAGAGLLAGALLL